MYHLPPLHFRINRIVMVFIAIICFILLRLFYLQITHTQHYLAQGQKNFLRTETTRSPRGTIFDRRGNALVTNRPVVNLCWNGTGNRTLSNEQNDMLELIEQIVGKPLISDNSLYEKIRCAERRCYQLQIAHDISHEQLSQLEELFPENSNLSLLADFQRHYPHGTYASHILGYLGHAPAMPVYGQTGLEKMCDELLKGQDGMIEKTINSLGRNIHTQELREAIIGQNLYTTIDLPMQHIAEQVFPQKYSGAFLVMDPHTGDILAALSRPSFDPTLFLNAISHTDWQELQVNNTFLNRAFNPYPPGSIFKLITVSAALESGLLDPEKIWYCNGHVDFLGRKYFCHHRWGHGKLNTMQAVAQSCNTLFYEIGKLIDIDLLAHYAYAFGLGKSTGIIFPERKGVVPSRAWKRKTKGESWWPGETLSVTIGQSFLLASPLQVARMVGGIFCGQLVKPRILLDEPISYEALPLKKETLNFLRQSMQFVVQSGTGKRVDIADMNIYAKTSTAQMSDLSKRTLGNSFLEHAWFVAYVQYGKRKPFVFVILVEHAGTSKIAAMIAKQFLLAYKQEPDYDYVEPNVRSEERNITQKRY